MNALAADSDDLDLKSFMDLHDIPIWPSENDHVEQVLRANGANVLLVERGLDEGAWKAALVRNEPDFFAASPETAQRIAHILAQGGIRVEGSSVSLKTASYRLVARFHWAAGDPGFGVNYGVVKRGRLEPVRQEYRLTGVGSACVRV